MRILFCFLAHFISILYGEIIIKNTGVATLSRGDVGIIFYVTLQNTGENKYHIYLRMIQCCEVFERNDVDCKMMRLMGGDMGFLQANVTRNISLLYPNMYLHNRKGQCLISVNYENGKDDMVECKGKIDFDTMISDTQIKPVLSGYYNRKELRKCNTADEDPLDDCEPVNCHMKYLGHRNYFNHKWKRCQKVPICISDPEKDLPDVSYFPISNKCRDLEALINVDDLRYLEKGTVEDECDNEPAPMLSANLRCHHGTLNNETGFCVCDEGWMSAPLDKDQFEPSLSTYHMCNIEISTWNGINSARIKMTALIVAILGAGFAMLMIMLALICNLLHNFLKIGPSYTHQTESDTSYCSEVGKNESSRSTSGTKNPNRTIRVESKRNSLIAENNKSADSNLRPSKDDDSSKERSKGSLKVVQTNLVPTTMTYMHESTDEESSYETEVEGEEDKN